MISTIPLSLEEIDVIKVNPFLEENDIEKIKAYLQQRKMEYGIFSEAKKENIPDEMSVNYETMLAKNPEMKPEEIIDLLRPFLDQEQIPAALEKVKSYFTSEKKQKQYGSQIENQKNNLLTLLKRDQIEIIETTADWKKAIKTAGRLLLDKEFIETRYIEKMIKIVEDKGPYIAIAPEICLAHAGIKDGVNKAAISLLIIRNGIKLGHQFDPIKFIFVLAPIDKKSHMPALTDIMEFANNRKLMDGLLEAESKDAAYKLLQNNFNELR